MAVDAIDREVIGNALRAVADEMAVTLVKASYSMVVRDHLDFSTAVCDARGRLVVQGTCLAIQLGALPFAMRAILEEYPEGLAPGDIVLTNDPYGGGATHLPDFVTAAPLHAGDRLLGYVIILAHKLDIGGRSAGGLAPDSTEIFQEGLRLPPLKYHDAGEESTVVRQFLAANVRTPEQVLGDLRGQVAALRTGQTRFDELVARYGADDVTDATNQILDHSEQLARHHLAALPDGRATFTDHIDDDGVGGPPVKVRVSLEIAGDRCIVDYTDLPPQVPSAINATLCNTYSVALFALRILIGADVAVNDGLARALEVRAEPGTIAFAKFPAAVGSRGIVLYRLWDALAGAIGALVPERAMAGGDGGYDILVFSGTYPDDRAFVLTELMCGSWGARTDRDGNDAISHPIVNMSNTPVEYLEAEYPLLVEEYALVPDGFGDGRYRGGCAVRRSFRARTGPITLQLRSDRRIHRPYGLAGGQDGPPSRTRRLARGGAEELPSKGEFLLEEGDLLIHTVCGGGGYGPPAERPEKLAQRDRDEQLRTSRAPASEVA